MFLVRLIPHNSFKSNFCATDMQKHFNITCLRARSPSFSDGEEGDRPQEDQAALYSSTVSLFAWTMFFFGVPPLFLCVYTVVARQQNRPVILDLLKDMSPWKAVTGMELYDKVADIKLT